MGLGQPHLLAPTIAGTRRTAFPQIRLQILLRRSIWPLLRTKNSFARGGALAFSEGGHYTTAVQSDAAAPQPTAARGSARV